MTLELSALGRRLDELEAGLREIRQALGAGAATLDALATLTPGEAPLDKPLAVAPGYSALSPELGVFLPSGEVKLRLDAGTDGPVLGLFAQPGKDAPEEVLFQVNIDRQHLRGHERVGLEAIVASGADLPPARVELRYMAGAEIARTLDLPVQQISGEGETLLRADHDFEPSLLRSETVTGLQVLLKLDPAVLGGSVKRLRIV